ncbi:MAG: hypothetical protein ABI556_04755 [Gemmatimonadales bacterium]
MNSKRKLVRERRGAMLVFIAIAGIVLMGFLAMTLDIGAGSRYRRIAQTAADAGAIGGGQEIYRLNNSATVIASATAEAVKNGFAAGDVTVNYPPATGTYAANTQYVEVIINKSIPTIFGSIFSLNSLAIQARGVAGVGSYGLNCVISLDPTGSGALYIDNGADLDTNCGVAINSNSNSALDLNSSGDLDARPAGVGIRGNYSAGGGASVLPAATTGAAAVVNPLASVTMPTVGACKPGFTTPTVVTGTMNLTPGVYCGGISISNASNTANLAPGTYIMAGGGLSVTNSAVINGTEVTIINTTGAYAFKPFNFGNGCKAKLTASTSGAFKGILFFQDPAAPSTPSSVFACSSDTPPELTGAIYLPNSSITFNGSNSGTQVLGSVIALKVVVSGKITIINDTSSGSALKRLSLVQ